MGGGGSQKVQETQYQQELAKIAAQEWNRYKNVYAPLENQYMKSVDKLGSERSYTDAAGAANTAYQQQFTEAGEEQQRSLAAAGIDPSSGRAQSARQELGTEQAASASQAQSQAQHSATEAYTGGLQNIVAMGKGQQTQTIGTLQDLGAAAQQKATQDAQTKAQESSLPAQLIGVGAGGYMGLSDADKQGVKDSFSNAFGGSGQSLGARNQNPFTMEA